MVRRPSSVATARRRAGRLGVMLLAATAATIALAAAGARAGIAAPARGCAGASATTFNQSEPWAQRTLRFDRVWPLTKGAGVVVAVVDTGVDASQPFLRGAVLPGRDVIGGGPANTDCSGHGTFVAGLIAGRPIAGFGFEGVAPQATILPVRQAYSNGQGTALTLARGIIWAVRNHARVINVSIVTADPAERLLQAVRFALARNVVIVAAAGNDFRQGNATQYPAGFPGVLAVGAVDQSGQRAGYSESGPDVAAPGTYVLGPGANGPGLVTMSGTSFATAFVSGVAALVRSYHPRLSAAQVIRRIEVTADHPPGNLPTPGLGWGIVNPYAAVTAVLPGAGRAPGPGRSRVPPPRAAAGPASGPRRLAAGAGVGGIALAAFILAGAAVLRYGRQRRGRAQPGEGGSGVG